MPRDKTFGYELTEKGKLDFFSFVLDDFESYIKVYWERTQTENWDDVPVLPESFRIEYIDNRFEEDFRVEDLRRLEEHCENDGDLDIQCYIDINAENCYRVKNTPGNLETIKEDDWYFQWEVDEDDNSFIIVRELALWSWMYYSRDVYSDLIFENMSNNTGIPIEDFDKDGVMMIT